MPCARYPRPLPEVSARLKRFLPASRRRGRCSGCDERSTRTGPRHTDRPRNRRHVASIYTEVQIGPVHWRATDRAVAVHLGVPADVQRHSRLPDKRHDLSHGNRHAVPIRQLARERHRRQGRYPVTAMHA